MSEIKEINPNLEPLWTVGQLAKYLSVNEITIYQWIRKGRIKYIKFSNRVRIPKSEVERVVGELKKRIQEPK